MVAAILHFQSGHMIDDVNSWSELRNKRNNREQAQKKATQSQLIGITATET